MLNIIEKAFDKLIESDKWKWIYVAYFVYYFIAVIYLFSQFFLRLGG